jgi:catechol 2,3-dioxygenase-like lactoylglutathione lyase family enzyme
MNRRDVGADCQAVRIIRRLQAESRPEETIGMSGSRDPRPVVVRRAPATAMMSGVHGRAVPVFASSDLAATLAFYEALGFENRGAPPEEWDYLIIGREGIELHFSAPPGAPCGPGICFLYVDDADAVHAAWQVSARPPARMSSPADQEYGMRTFALLDPDGNELRVGSSAPT